MLGKTNGWGELGLACALVVPLAFAAAPTAQAGVLYSAFAGACNNEGAAGTGCFEEDFRTPPASADTSTAIGNAIAGPGGIGSSARADGSVAPGIATAVPQGPSMSSGAALTLDDVVISAVSPSAATSIASSLRIASHYSILSQSNTVTGVNFDQFSQTGGTSTMSVSVGNDDFGVGFSNTVRLGRKVDATGEVSFVFSVSGDFPTVTTDELLAGVVLETPGFVLPVGTAFSLGLSISTTAGLTLSVPATCNVPPCTPTQVPTASGDIEMNAIDTFGFPTDGPVFDLPDGFTANSASGLIVDNRWVIPTSGPVSSVPEPASFLVFGAGLLGAGAVRRRRRS